MDCVSGVRSKDIMEQQLMDVTAENEYECITSAIFFPSRY